MPDPKKYKDPQVEGFLKNNPQYEPFFQNYPVPENEVSKNPYYQRYNENLDKKEPELKDKAELSYLSEILNKELEKKNPKVYGDLKSKYGWDESKPLAPKTRVSGADEIAKKNPDFFLTPEEQQKTLGDSWSRYVGLRGKYGKELNITGEGDDPSKPESWKVGARHAVAFNPVSYTNIISPEKNDQSNKNTSTFKRTETYDPNSEDKFSGHTVYNNINPDDKSQNASNKYVRRLSKVVPTFDGNTQVKTDNGVVFKEPGWTFNKVYDDGTKEQIGENEYQTLKQFNTLPAHLKSKYVEEVDPSSLTGKNKEIADQKIALLNKVQ
jgi:hypothetical protein